MKSSFGTKRSQVQILSPRPLFSGFVKASPVFLCLIFGQTGHKRTFPFSDATGKQPTMVDLCTLLSAFVRPFGKKQTWADVSGNGRSEGDKKGRDQRFIRSMTFSMYYSVFSYISYTRPLVKLTVSAALSCIVDSNAHTDLLRFPVRTLDADPHEQLH